MAAFKNKYYEEEWGVDVYAPGPAKGVSGKGRHKVEGWDNTMGTYEYTEKKKGYAIYDGRTNIMGYVLENGNFSYKGELDDYKASFLRSAKEVLVEQGLVYGR